MSVALTLSDNAVCGLSLFKEYLGTTTLDDELLTMYLNGASESVAQYLGYDLYRRDVTESFQAKGDYYLVPRHQPINSITSLAFEDSTVAATDYELDHGVVYLLYPAATVPGYNNAGRQANMRAARRDYTMVYNTGWITHVQANDLGGDYEDEDITLPGPILQATLAYASLLVKNHGLAGAGLPTRDKIGEAEREYSSSIRRGAGATQASSTGGIPEWIAGRLRSYKRIAIA